MRFSTVEEAIEAYRQGNILIVLDDEDRENEGDFAVAAEKVTPDMINFMATHGRGLICLALTGERVDQLALPQMVEANTSRFGTAFTVSIEARHGVTTGISAADRARTIHVAIDPASGPEELVRPGHVFPLRARAGGVLERAGQTEAAVDLARLAGLTAAGVICEIMNPDGTMARAPELEQVASKHGLKMVTVADIIAYRLRTETMIRVTAEADLQTAFGIFHFQLIENTLDGEHHIALVKGSIPSDRPILVRVQEQSTLGDVFHCGDALSSLNMHAALRRIEEEGSGLFLYLRKEGKGGLIAEEMNLRAVSREGTRSLAEAKQDLRLYGLGAQILRHLGARRIRLLTDHPRKIAALPGFGIVVEETVPLNVEKH